MNSSPSELPEDDDEIDPQYLAPAVVDGSGLHTMIDELTAALHVYVDVAVGIRAEFDSATAEDDPRIEAVEDRIGQINAAISDRFETDLGFASGHTTEAWDEDDDDLDEDLEEGSAVFEMGFIVSPSNDVPPLDDAFSVIESGGERIVRDLLVAGFDVREWGASRSDLDDEDEDDEESGDE